MIHGDMELVVHGAQSDHRSPTPVALGADDPGCEWRPLPATCPRALVWRWADIVAGRFALHAHWIRAGANDQR